MDDNGIEEDLTGSTFRITPKGWFSATLRRYGATREQSFEEWAKFEAFIVRRAAEDSEDSHAALVFDGAGGVCIGVEQEEVD